MNTSGDAAEQVVRLSLEGFEISAKIAGTSAKEVAVLLYTILKNKQQSRGKTKLLNLLKSGKELKIFTIKQDDLKKFSKKAKDYGILYSALINKKDKSSDGMVDIIVKAEDASRINRIVDRFELSSYDETTIRGEVEARRKAISKNVQSKTKEEKIDDDNINKPIKKEDNSLNPHLAKTVKSPQSEPSSKMPKSLDQGTSLKKEKTSVKKKLEIFKEIVKNKDSKENIPQITHVQPKKKKGKNR